MATKYMVSYRLYGGSCGNQCFEKPEDGLKYIADNKAMWTSHSTFSYEAGLAIGELTPVDLQNVLEGIVPAKFGKERAAEILEVSKQGGQITLPNGMKTVVPTDVSDYMTKEEKAYVREVWKTMPGYTCFRDAFNRVLEGRNV